MPFSAMPRDGFSAPLKAAARPVAASMMILGASAGVGLGTATFTAPVASAHDQVIKSNPDNGATLDKKPDQVEFEMTGRPKDQFASVRFLHSEGEGNGDVLFTVTPKIDKNKIIAEIPKDQEMPKGKYTVSYSIISSDGHKTDGAISFNLNAGDDSAAAQNGKEADNQDSNKGSDSQSSSVPSWLLPAAGVIVILGALVLAISRFRNTGKSSEPVEEIRETPEDRRS